MDTLNCRKRDQAICGNVRQEDRNPVPEDRIICVAGNIELKLGRRRLNHKLSKGLDDARKVEVRRGEEGSECTGGSGLWRRFTVVQDLDWYGISSG